MYAIEKGIEQESGIKKYSHWNARRETEEAKYSDRTL